MTHSIPPRPEAPGLRIIHAAIVLICATRALAYSDFLRPPHDSPGPLFLTDGGAYLWVYVGIWLVVGVLGVIDAVKARLGWAVPAFIGITTVWGLSYIGAWVAARLDTVSWMTGVLYLGLAALTAGAQQMISRQQDQISDLIDRLGRRTGEHPVVPVKEE